MKPTRPGWYHSEVWWWPHWGQISGPGVIVRIGLRYEARSHGIPKRFWRLESAMIWAESIALIAALDKPKETP